MAEANTVKRDGTNLRFFSGDGVVNNIAPGQAAVFEVSWRSSMFQTHLHSSLISPQIVLENSSESKEPGDYVLGMQKESNTEGLRVLIGGQPLTGEVLFAGLPFGGTKTVVEVYRSGLRKYDFTEQPITLYLASACDGDIKSTIKLKPQFLKTCAPVEFHNSIKTFALPPSSS